MVQYLERRERVFKFNAYLTWAVPEYTEAGQKKDEAWAAKRTPGWHIALKSPFRPVAQNRLLEIFGVRWFKWALGEFFENEGLDIGIDDGDPITIFPKATQFVRDDISTTNRFSDVIHASPHSLQNKLTLEKSGSKFDTFLIQRDWSEEFSYGIGKHFVVQVRMIFTLPPHYGIPDPLVAVQMFRSPITALPIQLTGLHRVHCERYPAAHENHPIEKIFFLSDIRRTCHLIPEFGRTMNLFWSRGPPALERFESFYLNGYLDLHSHIFLQC
ncbi:hypothetical protein FRC10_006970 [Ceratobasidium sp. 414]|nr:hypothetical protein FRC10_006970 [Ceratobasidium sp. 414]